MQEKNPTAKEWVKRFISAIILGIFVYFISIKIIFKPDFSELFIVGRNIILALGQPFLKFKAYLCVVYGLSPVVMMFLWWLFYKPNNLESYGNAEFATLENDEDYERMLLSKDTGLMLGCFIKKKLNGKEERTFIRATKPLATLIVAPPGTGKTASVALPNLFSLPNSVVVLDIKSELYEKSAGYRQKHFNNEILLFSPFSNENTLFFNPFDESVIKDMNFAQMKKLAEQIAGTIFVGEKGKENDHWIVSAKTMFVYFALYYMQKNGYTNLAELSQAHKKDYYNELEGEFLAMCQQEDPDTDKKMRDPEIDTLKPFFLQASQDKDIDEITRNQFRAYTTAAEQEFASIKSTYDTFMKVFSDPQVAKAVSSMNFTYEDLREKRISMYIVIQTADMDILAPLIRIFIESLFKNLMMKEESNPDKFIYFLLDEFVRFGKMPFLLEAPALCRSYGLIPVYITQSYEQIKKYYGDDDLKIIKSTVGYQVVFRMNSPEDAKVLSEMIGDFTRKKVSQSKGNLDILKRNDSVSNEGYKLVTVQDILSNPIDQIYILVGGFFNRPIKANVNFWFKNPQWQDADKIKVIPKEELEKAQTEETNKNEEINENIDEQSPQENNGGKQETKQDENREKSQESNENKEDKPALKEAGGFKIYPNKPA
ncbi:type IV secretory system conjugative DNA transfer family protein [Campylobacter sp. MIT 97-5078]|uniref:type IV secretory system conjugative DNA transfer family protein n=1 Tax=Campylobacter sp. MIT 97-5078 TaxID=1548153 RepID=UPI00051326FA|nr:type IV secretory system conjugative DNA transfer family protein [Campylobacter sp. MIT 97-5078]KGI55666.1 hypothetical protein LR59_10965 [Campylobacter sp. MIT 97-5078]KGI56812.1 hypothetical protein LR59_04840 [Campylobacter sp. MIT 97-5078]TQR25589.1 hypothetical protein DMB91_07235 [Campylobacter sp. MIT 97-5078]